MAGLVAYALVGPSRVLIMGPDSSLAPIIAAAVLPLAGADPDRAVALSGLMAIIAGTALWLGGHLRLGFVMSLLSQPIRLGYMSGVAATVLVGQFPKLLGFSIPPGTVVEDLRPIADGIAEGRAGGAAATIGLLTLAAILIQRHRHPKLPGFLLAVLGSGVAVWALDLRSVPVVGALPGGLPRPLLGSLRWDDLGALAGPALGLALVAFADSGILSRVLALREGRPPDDSAEMAALGVTNLACGALGGFPVSASASRTPVAIGSGARTPIVGLLAATLVLVLTLAAPDLTRHLPAPALAAVVMTAGFLLIDRPGTIRLWRTRPDELALAAAATAGVVVLGVLWGISLAIGLSLVAFVGHAFRPHTAELVRVPHRKGYHDVERHPDGHRIPGLVLARFDAPLFFANASAFSGFIRHLVETAPEPVRWLVVAAEPITDIDTTAADQLVALADELAVRQVRFVFAELKGPAKDRLVRYGLDARLGTDHFYPTLGAAVAEYRHTTAAEDQRPPAEGLPPLRRAETKPQDRESLSGRHRSSSEIERSKMNVITVGVDGSEEARSALRYALDEAQLRGAEVHAVLAYSPLPYLAGDTVLQFDAPAEVQSEELLRKEVEPVASEFPGVKVTTRAILGSPASTLIEAALGSDLLVVGCRGRGGFAGLLLGSVSQQCVHHAPCPVVVVPHA